LIVDKVVLINKEPYGQVIYPSRTKIKKKVSTELTVIFVNPRLVMSGYRLW
jgi:hypothetical protein